MGNRPEKDNRMPKDMQEEWEEDSAEEELGSSYLLHLVRGISICSSISASSAFASLYDEVIEEYIDDDGNVYLIEEYCESETKKDSDHAVSPSDHEESLHDDDEDQKHAVDVGYKGRKPKRGPPFRRPSDLSTIKIGEQDLATKTTQNHGSRKMKKKQHSRPTFLRSLSTLSTFRRPAQFTSTAA